MSLGIYPLFNPRLVGTTYNAVGEGLASSYHALDNIAWAANLKPFTAFSDTRPVPEGFEGDPDELRQVMGECSQWFDAADGHAAMHALLSHLKANAEVADWLDEAEMVIAELEELVRVLAVAETEGARFRLEMS
jgi:hypothetical protein